MQNLKIKFGDSVPKLNYTIYPMSLASTMIPEVVRVI